MFERSEVVFPRCDYADLLQASGFIHSLVRFTSSAAIQVFFSFLSHIELPQGENKSVGHCSGFEKYKHTVRGGAGGPRRRLRTRRSIKQKPFY